MNSSKLKPRGIIPQFLLLIQLCGILFPALSSPAEPLIFSPQTHHAIMSIQGFDTTANFDPTDGTFVRLNDNHYYRLWVGNLEWDYIATNRRAWKLGLSGSQAESSDGTYLRKNSTLNYGYLGYQHYLRATPIKIKPEILLLYPITPFNTQTDEVLNSEGVLEAKLGTWLQKRWGLLEIYSYLGGNYRNEGRSSLFEYVLGSKFHGDGWGLGGEINGYQSITKDDYTQKPEVKSALTTQVNAGSLKLYTVNPELLSAKGFITTQLSEGWGVQISYQVDLQGKNMAKGTTWGAQMEWNFGGPSSSTDSQFSYTKSRRRSESKSTLDKFHIESTEYDESLFREEIPKPLLKKKGPSVQQMLDEAEKTLDK